MVLPITDLNLTDLTDDIYAIKNREYLENINTLSEQFWNHEVTAKTEAISCKIFEQLMIKLFYTPGFKTLRQEMRLHETIDYCKGLEMSHFTKLFKLFVHGGEHNRNLMSKMCFQKVLACMFRPIPMSNPTLVNYEPKRLCSVIDLIYKSLFGNLLKDAEKDLKEAKGKDSKKLKVAPEKENPLLKVYCYSISREQGEALLEKTNLFFQLRLSDPGYGMGLNLILSTREPDDERQRQRQVLEQESLRNCPGCTEHIDREKTGNWLIRTCKKIVGHNVNRLQGTVEKIQTVQHELLITASGNQIQSSFRNANGVLHNSLQFLEPDIKKMMAKWAKNVALGMGREPVTTHPNRYIYRSFDPAPTITGPIYEGLNFLDLRQGYDQRGKDFWYQVCHVAYDLWEVSELITPGQMTMNEFVTVMNDFLNSRRNVYKHCRTKDVSGSSYKFGLDKSSLERLFWLSTSGINQSINRNSFYKICAGILLPSLETEHTGSDKEPYNLKEVIDLLYRSLHDTPWQQLFTTPGLSRREAETILNTPAAPDAPIPPTFGFLLRLSEVQVTNTMTSGLHLVLSSRKPININGTTDTSRHIKLTARSLTERDLGGTCDFVDRFGKPHSTLNFLLDDLLADADLWDDPEKTMTRSSLKVLQKAIEESESHAKEMGLGLGLGLGLDSTLSLGKKPMTEKDEKEARARERDRDRDGDADMISHGPGSGSGPSGPGNGSGPLWATGSPKVGETNTDQQVAAEQIVHAV